MANPQNLVEYTTAKRSASEVRAMTRKGGINSGITRRRKKTISAYMKMLVKIPATKDWQKRINEVMGTEGEVYDNALAISIAQLKAALSGDNKAIQEIRNMIGDFDKVPALTSGGTTIQINYIGVSDEAQEALKNFKTRRKKSFDDAQTIDVDE